MLLITSFLGSVIGFVVCYKTLTRLQTVHHPARMRICMANSMALAFIFAMLIELTTGSKALAVLVPVLTVCLPIVFMMKPFSMLDVVESCTATLMSVSMSVMLIGMVGIDVIWSIQCILLVIEIILYVMVARQTRAV